MIKPGEVQKKAHEAGVRDQQIEKDYILSWILQGISRHPVLSINLIFKGGTALKKVYFRDYRYSEDLDFTLANPQLQNQQIFVWFSEVFDFVRETANIPLEIIDDNEHEDGGINFYIGFVGPLGGLGANKKVKVDISRTENMAFAPVRQEVITGYSDHEEHWMFCYCLEEILLEKLRSVIQRMQARDLYDIWYLLEVHGMAIELYVNEFKAKCTDKDLSPADFHAKLRERMPQYKGRWTKSMSDQIRDLPDFEQVEREVMRCLKSINFS